MKITVTESMFHDAFHKMGRGDQFSYDGRSTLFDWLEENASPDDELDVIALCCEFSEDTFENVASDHGIDVEGMDEDERQSAILEYLEENSTVVWHDDGRVLYQQF